MQVHLVVLILPRRAAALASVAGDRHLPVAALRLAVDALNQLGMPRRTPPVLLNASAGFAQGWFFGIGGLAWGLARVLG